MGLFALPPEALTALVDFKALCADIRMIRKLLERQVELEESRGQKVDYSVVTGPVENAEPVTATP